MKHYTCDKCGMPMDRVHKMDIDGQRYDICSKCRETIMQGIKGRGEYIPKEIDFKKDFKDFHHY